MTDEKFLRIRDVVQTTGLSRSMVYREVNAGRFPRPVPLGERAMAWVSSEVQGWVRERIESRNRIVGKDVDSTNKIKETA